MAGCYQLTISYWCIYSIQLQMKTLLLTKEIHATAQKVWNTLWDRATYSKWTSAFDPSDPVGGSMQTDWQVGGETLFLDSNGNGMVATIKSIDEPYELVFEHRGEFVGGREGVTSEEVKSWAGSLEEYYLTEQNGVTTLRVSLQAPDEGVAAMDRGFTDGLEVVKRLAEQ